MFPFLPSLEVNADREPRTLSAVVVIPWLCMACGVMLLVQMVEQWCSPNGKLGGVTDHQTIDPALANSSRVMSALKLLFSFCLAAGGAAFTKRSFVWGPTVLLCLMLPVLAHMHMPTQHGEGSQTAHTVSIVACCFACIVITSYLRSFGPGSKQPLPPAADGDHSHAE